MRALRTALAVPRYGGSYPHGPGDRGRHSPGGRGRGLSWGPLRRCWTTGVVVFEIAEVVREKKKSGLRKRGRRVGRIESACRSPAKSRSFLRFAPVFFRLAAGVRAPPLFLRDRVKSCDFLHLFSHLLLPHQHTGAQHTRDCRPHSARGTYAC